MSSQAFVDLRYGKITCDGGGTIPVQSRRRVNGHRVMREASTEKAMSDKLRYLETRFSGESNAIYDESSAAFEGGWAEAWSEVRREAQQVAASKTKYKGKLTAYVYDATINAGLGRQSDERMHEVARAYIQRVRAGGTEMRGVTYAIHHNGQHSHIHMMYVTRHTQDFKQTESLKQHMRQAADRICERGQEQQHEQHHDDHEQGRGR